MKDLKIIMKTDKVLSVCQSTLMVQLRPLLIASTTITTTTIIIPEQNSKSYHGENKEENFTPFDPSPPKKCRCLKWMVPYGKISR